MPTILTIAGSDPTGGAGVQADLQTFCSLGSHGAAVITSITAQDTASVRSTHHLPAEWIGEQLAGLLEDVAIDSAKTGMLGNAAIAETVAEVLCQWPDIPLVVDPVVWSTSGLALLDGPGVEAVRRRLLPRATVVTPNLAEAQVLTGMTVADVSGMREAARRLTDTGARAALVKGGHLPDEPVDVLCVGGDLLEFAGPRITAERRVHGTGCVLAAALATFLGQGRSIPSATERARAYLAAGMRRARAIGHGAAVVDFGAAAAALQPGVHDA